MADEGEKKELSEEEERMRLLQMIKDSSNGPEQAKRRIEELDKMVQGLKKRRRLCGEPGGLQAADEAVPSPCRRPRRIGASSLRTA